MAPLYGWGPCGERLEGLVPHGHWQTLTFIGALRCDRLTAPWLIDGPINAEIFTTYVEQVLVPTLGCNRADPISKQPMIAQFNVNLLGGTGSVMRSGGTAKDQLACLDSIKSFSSNAIRAAADMTEARQCDATSPSGWEADRSGRPPC